MTAPTTGYLALPLRSEAQARAEQAVEQERRIIHRNAQLGLRSWRPRAEEAT